MFNFRLNYFVVYFEKCKKKDKACIEFLYEIGSMTFNQEKQAGNGTLPACLFSAATEINPVRYLAFHFSIVTM